MNTPIIFYSTDLQDIANKERTAGCCIHLVCTRGKGRFRFADRVVTFSAGQMVVCPHPELISECAGSRNLKVVMIVATHQFILAQLPRNHYGIGGRAMLRNDPVIDLQPDDVQRLVNDMELIRQHISLTDHRYQLEVLGSSILTMVYDIFDVHSRRDGLHHPSHQTHNLIRELRELLESGMTEREREVRYYADLLHVSPKYLSDVVHRSTGDSVVKLIDTYTLPILVEYLRTPHLSFTQIAERMNFTTLSYFGRYVKKHLGVTPTQYREAGSPKMG